MNTEAKKYFYPNNMGRIVLLAMEDVLGRNGLNTVLNLANLSATINDLPPANFDRQFSFDHLSSIMSAIESYFGPHAGRGLALRSGRACLKYGLREYGPLLGVSDMTFRLLPLATKIKTGAEMFALAFNKFSDQRVRLEDSKDELYWHIECCPICFQRNSKDPVCHLAVGILQEALYWISGGKNFFVEEIACIAQGNEACIIKIKKEPLS
jgi:predicted hydrocarbon binding protein